MLGLGLGARAPIFLLCVIIPTDSVHVCVYFCVPQLCAIYIFMNSMTGLRISIVRIAHARL